MDIVILQFCKMIGGWCGVAGTRGQRPAANVHVRSLRLDDKFTGKYSVLNHDIVHIFLLLEKIF